VNVISTLWNIQGHEIRLGTGIRAMPEFVKFVDRSMMWSAMWNIVAEHRVVDEGPIGAHEDLFVKFG
jgi:hypothetical protein